MRRYNRRELITCNDLMSVPWVRRIEEDMATLTITLWVPWYCPSARKVLRYVYPRIAAGLAIELRREFP